MNDDIILIVQAIMNHFWLISESIEVTAAMTQCFGSVRSLTESNTAYLIR